MAHKATKKLKHMKEMRKVFDFGTNKTVGHWFPQHMSKGMKTILNTVKNVDCLIEVHDARLPLTGLNKKMREITSLKNRILVLNKIDLAPSVKQYSDALTKHYLKNYNYQKLVFTKCDKGKFDSTYHKSVLDIIPQCVDVIESNPRYERASEMDYNIMVIGIPNVGKSSLINALRHKYMRKGVASPVGKNPGYTKAVQNRVKVCDNPRVYLVDTPGILNPKIETLEEGMKLAICNNVSEHVVGNAMSADYLLFLLNTYMQTNYVKHYNLQEPIDDIKYILKELSDHGNNYQVHKIFTGTGDRIIRIPCYEKIALKMLTDFREGKLGKISLDNLTSFPTNAY